VIITGAVYVNGLIYEHVEITLDLVIENVGTVFHGDIDVYLDDENTWQLTCTQEEEDMFESWLENQVDDEDDNLY